MRKSEFWSYDKHKRLDRTGGRWHFVRHELSERDDEKRPYEIYFRGEDRNEFGVIGFGGGKEFPYRNYEALIGKIMNNTPFRRSLLDADTEAVWKKNWK
jgi:hypothetical protein